MTNAKREMPCLGSVILVQYFAGLLGPEESQRSFLQIVPWPLCLAHAKASQLCYTRAAASAAALPPELCSPKIRNMPHEQQLSRKEQCRTLRNVCQRRRSYAAPCRYVSFSELVSMVRPSFLLFSHRDRCPWKQRIFLMFGAVLLKLLWKNPRSLDWKRRALFVSGVVTSKLLWRSTRSFVCL